jgi:hypothetical protein
VSRSALTQSLIGLTRVAITVVMIAIALGLVRCARIHNDRTVEHVADERRARHVQELKQLSRAEGKTLSSVIRQPHSVTLTFTDGSTIKVHGHGRYGDVIAAFWTPEP